MPDFPPDYLWGSSTAAHQVEGNNVNNDWWASKTLRAGGRRAGRATPSTSFHRTRRTSPCSRRWGTTPPSVARVVAHRARARRVEPRRPRPLPSRALSLGDNGLTASTPSITSPSRAGSRSAVAGSGGGGGALRALLRARGGRARRPHALRVHRERAADRQHVRILLGYHPPGSQNPNLWRRATRALLEAHGAACARWARGRAPRGRASASRCRPSSPRVRTIRAASPWPRRSGAGSSTFTSTAWRARRPATPRRPVLHAHRADPACPEASGPRLRVRPSR